MISKKKLAFNLLITCMIYILLISMLWLSVLALNYTYIFPPITTAIFFTSLLVTNASIIVSIFVFYHVERKFALIERKEGSKSTRRKKWLIIKLSLVIGVGISIITALIVVVFSGTFPVSTLIEFIYSPIMLIITIEFLTFGLLLAALFPSKKWRWSLIKSAICVFFLLSFFNTMIISTMPVLMTVNHPDSEWNSGYVVHILPAVNDNRILLKTSFLIPITNPRLNVNGTYFSGEKTDTYGYFWCFNAFNLLSNTTYQLILENALGQRLCDPWTIKTFPSSNSTPNHLRILAFTGSGGHDACRSWYGTGQIPLYIRQLLLNKALSLEPDIIIGSGDQIYYDVRYGVSSKNMGDSIRAIAYNGRLNPFIDVLGTANEIVLRNAVGPQIAYLYGTACRSIPTYFILDDHDYFANDDAVEKFSVNFQLLMAGLDPFIFPCVTFPPDEFSLKLCRAAQKLYLPEFLPDENRPLSLPSTGASDRSENVSECFGTVRYGNLLEGLLYDVRRYVTLTGASATFIPTDVENWIINRTLTANTTYLINFSPISVGWSAGKWLSWYPDVRSEINGQPVLTNDTSKYLWQEGWFEQHNRLLNASFATQNSTPLFVCGDMHAQTAGMILKSGSLDFSTNPIPSLLTGSLSVDGGGFPSGGLRGIEATPPNDLQVFQNLTSYEKAGFVLMDITSTRIQIDFYAWRLGLDLIQMIPNLQPHFTFTIEAK